MTWTQNYDPLGHPFFSTLLASLPIVLLLGSIALLRIRIHYAALLSLAAAFLVATWGFGMPVGAAAATSFYGAAFGLFPIGWIILNLIFLYQLTVHKGYFSIIRSTLASLAPDPRVQVVLIAFCFGAFFEGAAGFGTPVAVTAAILIQLGFRPLAASGLSLIANTAPVAFGALGTPIIALQSVTGLDLYDLSKMVGRQLPFFSLLVPFWVVWAMAGWRGMLEVWPAALTAGLGFAIPQFLVANYLGPMLVDIVASLVAMAAVTVLLQFWQPKTIWKLDQQKGADLPEEKPLPPPHEKAGGLEAEILEEMNRRPDGPVTTAQKWNAWIPWILLSLIVFIWGIPQIKKTMNGWHAPEVEVMGLHHVVLRAPPVAPVGSPPEKAVFTLNYISATGTAILVSAVIGGFFMRYRTGELVRIYGQTFWKVRYSLITIAAMLSLGYVTKYSGADATLGLALAKTGVLYPFFGTLLGWLGVALTGSDTSSNVLFGSLQKITSEQIGVSPTLMAAANSSGGVMGKMVDAQSIVVASTATNWYGHEGEILRYVFFHSIALATLVGLLVFLQAYVSPFTRMVP